MYCGTAVTKRSTNIYHALLLSVSTHTLKHRIPSHISTEFLTRQECSGWSRNTLPHLLPILHPYHPNLPTTNPHAADRCRGGSGRGLCVRQVCGLVIYTIYIHTRIVHTHTHTQCLCVCVCVCVQCIRLIPLP